MDVFIPPDSSLGRRFLQRERYGRHGSVNIGMPKRVQQDQDEVRLSDV